MSDSKDREPETFTDVLRRIFKKVLDGIGGFLNRLGVKPNMVTIAGLLGNIASGALVATGHLFYGGLIALVVGPLDALDGTMARLRGESGKFGAFVDSVTDRYSEIVLYAGLLIYYAQRGTWQGVILVFLAATGSIMVSYTRARAESLGYSAKIGLLTKAERYLVLIPGIILNWTIASLWILAIFTNFTAFQRFIYVRRQAKNSEVNKIN